MVNTGSDDQSVHPPHDNEATSRSTGFSMESLDLGPPIATLRSLGALSKKGTSPGSHIDPESRTIRAKNHPSYDPVSRGILSMDDAERAIRMYYLPFYSNASAKSYIDSSIIAIL